MQISFEFVQKKYLRSPLFWNIVERVRRINAEAHQNHICIWIRQWTQAIVVILSGSIPKSKLHLITDSFNNNVSNQINSQSVMVYSSKVN